MSSLGFYWHFAVKSQSSACSQPCQDPPSPRRIRRARLNYPEPLSNLKAALASPRATRDILLRWKGNLLPLGEGGFPRTSPSIHPQWGHMGVDGESQCLSPSCVFPPSCYSSCWVFNNPVDVTNNITRRIQKKKKTNTPSLPAGSHCSPCPAPLLWERLHSPFANSAPRCPNTTSCHD